MTLSTDLTATSRSAQQPNKAASVRIWRIGSTIVKYLLLFFFAAFFVLPWVWMNSTSLKNPDELAVNPIIWIPSPIRWDNYIQALARAEFARFFANTLLIAVPSVIGALLSNSMVAYGFARIRWPGREIVFALVLATLILPGFVTFIPLYLIFMSLPEELADAARVDGASELRIFSQIILPLSRPALAVVALFQFIGSWKDYFGPLIYINDKALYTISLGIANMRSSYGFSNFAWIMAATCMSVLPIIVLFFFAQRTFIEGIALSGLKG